MLKRIEIKMTLLREKKYLKLMADQFKNSRRGFRVVYLEVKVMRDAAKEPLATVYQKHNSVLSRKALYTG